MSSTEIGTQAATSRVLNAVSSLVGQLKKEPEQANAQFKVKARLDEGVLAKVSVRDFEFIPDEPDVLGGTNRGPNPVELVLGAFATTIKTSETDRVKLEQLIRFAETKCPVYDILANPVKVGGTFKVEAVN